ncbi:MAG: hypothetical protein IKU25_03650 [Clostridia bacterium]|nr:hypothetical protein [Clostridia bacterium]
MDIKISNGDWATDECGMPITISNETELLQQAFLRLKIPKGAFLHDAEFGSRFAEITPENRENADKLAFLFAQQALSPLASQMRVSGANVQFGEKNVITISAVIGAEKEVQFTI